MVDKEREAQVCEAVGKADAEALRANNGLAAKLAAPVATALLVAFLLAAILINALPDKKYVVTARAGGKIAYRSLDGTGDMHVMTFQDEQPNTAGGFYQYINVGDTIAGPGCFLDALVNESKSNPWLERCTIQKVNGKTLKELVVIARRDSLLNEMNVKQR